MISKRLIISIILAFVLTIVSTTSALAVPPNPHSFYGTVKINGANVPVGTAVTAWCGGVKYATSPYLFDDDINDIDYGNTVYAFNVPGDDLTTTGIIEGCASGQQIIFMIGLFTADQTATWQGSTNVRLNLTVSPTAVPFTISGHTGIGGVTITYDGGSTTSDTGGFYSFEVEDGWVGTVTPSKTGYTFSPPYRIYVNVMYNQLDQDFFPAESEPPVLPSSFYGTVKSKGANVPPGTQVTARIKGHVFSTSPYMLNNGDTVYTVNVPGDILSTTDVIEGGVAGDTVVFYVGSTQADQTGVWSSGSNVELNLTVELPDYVQIFLPLIAR
jgi:hypothetical protein